MTKNFARLLLSFTVFIFVLQSDAFAQQVRINPFTVKSSTLLEELKALKSANPKISTEELVKSANTLFQTKGLNYSFALDSGVCQQVTELKAKQKTPNSPITLNAKLNSFEGEKANLTLPPIRFGKDVNRCFSSLPLIEVTEADFVTFVETKTVKFYKPQNFNFSEVVLVDNKTYKTSIRNWKVPFCATPLSISEDGKNLYLNLPAAELGEMFLIAYDDGTMQFYAKKDVDLFEKNILPESVTKPLNLPNASFVSFGTGEKQHILRFTDTCE